MKLKDLDKIDRPREKLFRYGVEKLTNSELLALIIGTGRKGENVINLSKKILKLYQTNPTTSVTDKDLLKITGLGRAKVGAIQAAFELSRRLLHGKKTSLLMTPKDVWRAMQGIRDNKKEYFVIFFLDVKNQIITKEIISIGILNSSLVHPREVFEPAIKNLSAQIILSHNHPSNEVFPSEEDLIMTKRLVEAGKIIGIEILDHVIVSSDSFFSLKEKGLIG